MYQHGTMVLIIKLTAPANNIFQSEQQNLCNGINCEEYFFSCVGTMDRPAAKSWTNGVYNNIKKFDFQVN